jgi:hypothetical protein
MNAQDNPISDPLNSPTSDLLLPGTAFFTTLAFGAIATEIAPLYALLTAVNQAIGRRRSYPAVLASAQLVRAFENLGFEAALLAGCTTLVRRDQQTSRPDTIDIGVWKHLPTTRQDGTTDGHGVAWTSTFGRIIDLGLCNHPLMIEMSADNEKMTSPVVLEIPGGKNQLLDSRSRVMTIRDPFLIGWNFFPSATKPLDAFLTRHAGAVEHGGLALANVAIDLLSALAVYKDLAELKELYPRLAELMSKVDMPNYSA